MDEIVTVEKFESGEIKLTDEWFEPIFRNASLYGIPFKELVGFKGRKTGTLLHSDFDNILVPNKEKG